MHCRTLSSLHGLYPLDAISHMPHPQIAKYLGCKIDLKLKITITGPETVFCIANALSSCSKPDYKGLVRNGM